MGIDMIISIPDKISLFFDILNFIVIFIITYITIQYRNIIHERFPNLREFYDLATIGLVIALIGRFFDIVTEFSINGTLLKTEVDGRLIKAIYVLSIAIIGFGWLKLLFGLAKKYKPVPIVKEEIKTKTEVILDPGVYLCPNKDTCCEYFTSLLKDRSGLIISRDPPEIIRETLELKETPILWITKIENKDAVYPTNLAYLMQTLVDFMKSKNLPKVILLDGLEYLILENTFASVFKFLTTLKDYAMLYDSIILVPIESRTYAERNLHLLLREFEVLE